MTEIATPAKAKATKKAKVVSETDGFKTFKVNKTSVGGRTRTIVEFCNDEVVSSLQNIVRFDELYEDDPKVSVDKLCSKYETIKDCVRKNKQRFGNLAELVGFLTEENRVFIGQMDNMIKGGVMSFKCLPHIFTKDTEIYFNDGEVVRAGLVHDTKLEETWMGTFIVIYYDFLISNGKSFYKQRGRLKVREFEDTIPIDQLYIKRMTPEKKEWLTARGRNYAKYSLGHEFLTYTGHMEEKKWWSWDLLRADGRFMSDVQTYTQFSDDHQFSDSMNNDDDDDSITFDNIDANLWMADAYLYGFSFVTKKWGRFKVEMAKEIEFRQDAFDLLVLDPEKKDMVKALVKNSGGAFSDIISGKGGGCIFLLHGEPGTGKTLTAESVSELLTRPLYSVSVGELGVDPESLEKTLREILDLAQIWNAVILIDEADIFLERRSEGDILRNAMVGIFLRLLEYHQGVMFLTTNRVKDFDEAFHSRISIALNYAPLNREARVVIWNNLLRAAKVELEDPTQTHNLAITLSEYDINGRQIKSAIRLAQTLATENGEKLTRRHFQRTINLAVQFRKDILVKA